MDDSEDINLKSSQKLMSKKKSDLVGNKVIKKTDLVSSDKGYNISNSLNFLDPYRASSNSSIIRSDSPPRPVIHVQPLARFPKNSIHQTLASHISLSEIRKFIDYAQIRKNFPFTKNISKFICYDCNMIKGLVRLKCSHSVCIGCYKKSLLDYEKNPNISTFKAIRCTQCQFLPTITEIYYFLDESRTRADEFMEIRVLKRCFWCGRKLNLMNEYLPELECLDLCRECYADQLFFKEKNCLVCKLPYKNINNTLQRKSMCCICNTVCSIVAAAMRSYYNNRMICYDCHKQIVEGDKWDEAFGKMNINKGKSLIGFYYNKTCPSCSCHKPLSELNTCKKCGNFKCDDCQSEDPSCKFCEIAIAV